MPTYVPGVGPSNARIIVCGDYPGKEEENQQMPLVGAAGKMLEHMFANAGVDWRTIYKTNVVKHRPPNSDIKRISETGKNIDDYIPQLWEEIHGIEPNVVVTLGPLALEVLTGQKEIKKYRGSILQSSHGYPKIVPTINPASMASYSEDEAGGMMTWKDLTYIQWDINRAVHQSTFKELILPRRTLHVARTSLDLYRFITRYKGCRHVSVDIETFRTIPICIGFAFCKEDAISVPLFDVQSPENPNGIPLSDMAEIWRLVAELLADPTIMKIGQNFQFDEGLLWRCLNRTVDFGMMVNGFFFDTLLAFRTLYPELPGKLEFIASVLTEEPYWKEEGKSYNPKKDKLSKLLLYNAKDAAVTFEVFEKELEELQQRGLEQFFFERVMPLHPFYSRMSDRGILRDEVKNAELKAIYKAKNKVLEARLLELTDGVECNVNSNGATGQVARLLFGLFKLPPRGGTDEKTLSALLRNNVKDSIHKEAIENILEQRKVKKTISTYLNFKVHSDGRARTGVNIALETGRSSNRIFKQPVTTESYGIAFQTITKNSEVGEEIREQFIPDPGYVFIEADLSGAEARVVAILARDEKLQKIFNYNVDIHRVTASWLFERGNPLLLEQFFVAKDDALCKQLAEDINNELKKLIFDFERQMGKRFRHAGHYDMGKREASSQAGISEWKAGKLLTQFHNTNPNIRGVFHKEIQEAIAASSQRILRNPFGRERQFLNKLGNDLYKEAYAQIPQSTVSDQTKFAGVRMERRFPAFQILSESHDALFGQVLIAKSDEAIRILTEEMETPINFKLCTLSSDTDLVIPCEVKIGKKNWREMEKVKI